MNEPLNYSMLWLWHEEVATNPNMRNINMKRKNLRKRSTELRFGCYWFNLRFVRDTKMDMLRHEVKIIEYQRRGANMACSECKK